MLGVVEVGGTRRPPGTSWGVITGASRDRQGSGRYLKSVIKLPATSQEGSVWENANYTGGFSLQSLPPHLIHSLVRTGPDWKYKT